ncbi:hypothetical protein GGR02_001080 [Anoxybacillus voinovskiensis]|uniref:Uncharacterized protein n=1 Tax=Anoxybacteroides voinovskiense TaxID=230470 RepID=A0A840DTG1_9BACL|nr:hypothetical protein [Anoxybacillus voinovskiensis]MBB4073318.1 hypothetical protein [Anoxybacillus voinovskiensis]GGJ62278.1 hypothetical protein GCM10008982_09070 [Anoxybacillus voinovskiensis]
MKNSTILQTGIEWIKRRVKKRLEQGQKKEIKRTIRKMSKKGMNVAEIANILDMAEDVRERLKK